VNVEGLWDPATQDIPLLRKAVEKYLQAVTQSPNWPADFEASDTTS